MTRTQANTAGCLSAVSCVTVSPEKVSAPEKTVFHQPTSVSWLLVSLSLSPRIHLINPITESPYLVIRTHCLHHRSLHLLYQFP